MASPQVSPLPIGLEPFAQQLRVTTPSDLVMPGHIFPLIAKQGGVLTRAGHTEAGCDLARLSGYEPASVIVEVMNEDGTMAKRPELEQFAQKHQLKIGTIADLIHYRAVHDTTVLQVDSRKVATDAGEFDLTTFRDSTRSASLRHESGTLTPEEPCLVRVQTVSFLRDVLGTVRPIQRLMVHTRSAQPDCCRGFRRVGVSE